VTELWIDIETYSDVDLREASVYRYVESPVFQIILAGWALDDGPVQMC
jgi:DNA polymerase